MIDAKDILQYRLHESNNEAIRFFFERLRRESPRILEIGTKRWNDKQPTHHKEFFVDRGVIPGKYVMTDVTPGADVDITSDAHFLSLALGSDEFDGIWSSSTWEHLHSPWKASREVLKVLAPKGVFFIQTHFTFREHGYPEDYFRFTRRALERCFNSASEVVSCYDFPVSISCRHPVEIQPGYFNVCIAGVK